MAQEEFKRYFLVADSDKDGVVGIQDALFFKKSKLPTPILGQVSIYVFIVSLPCRYGNSLMLTTKANSIWR